MESRVNEPRNEEISDGLRRCVDVGEIREPLSEVRGRGRGRRTGQTIKRETMKHGRPGPHQRTTPGPGRDRETTPTAPTSQSAAGRTNENKADTSGLRGEIGSSQSRWKGSLSAYVVPIESRGTEKRQDPGSREGRRPRTGIDAGRHELPH